MSGLPRSHFVGDDFVMLYPDLVKDCDGDYTAAGVLQRIKWKAEPRGGEWKVSQDDLAEAMWLTRNQVRRALTILISKGYIAVRHEPGSYDRTSIYSVVFAEEPDITIGDPAPIDGVPDHQSSIEEKKEETKTSVVPTERRCEEEEDAPTIPDRSHYSFGAKNGIDNEAVRLLAQRFTEEHPNRARPGAAFTRYLAVATRVLAADEWADIDDALNAITDAYNDDPQDTYVNDGHNLNPGA